MHMARKAGARVAVGAFAVAAGIVAGPATASAATFVGVNSTAIVTPAAINQTEASTYPSTISVPAIAGTVSGVSVALHGFSDSFTPDVQIVLVAPDSRALLLMNAVGTNGAVSNLELSFDDQAANNAPAVSALTSGTYKPTNWDASQPPNFPSPGPGTAWASPGPAGGASATFASAFGGASPSGSWNLFVQDKSTSDGTIAGGWQLTLTTQEPQAHRKKKCKKKHKHSAAAAKKKCKKKRR